MPVLGCAAVVSFLVLAQTAPTGDESATPSAAATTSDQVMQIVNQECPTYDAVSSGDRRLRIAL